METEPHSDEGTSHSGEHPPPVSEAAFTPSSAEPIRASVPTVTQQNVTPDLDAKSGESQQPKCSNPLLVRVIEDDELSSFETKTVQFGKWTLVVAAFSLLAACAAAWFVYQQFTEMAAQTDLLSRSAQQSREDSAASSIATAKQLKGLQAQITAAQNGTKALQGQLKIASKQFEANQQLIASQGASITISDHSAIAPLAFHENGEVNANIGVSLNNVGGLTATKVTVRSQPYYSQWGENIFREPQQRQRDFCSKPIPTYPGDVIDTSLTILPHTSRPYQINFGFRKPEPGEIIDWPPKGTADQLPKKKVIFLIVVGCVDYQSGLMSGSHQTGFVFWIQKGTGPNGNAPGPIPYGVDIPKDQIIVSPNFFGQGKSY